MPPGHHRPKALKGMHFPHRNKCDGLSGLRQLCRCLPGLKGEKALKMVPFAGDDAEAARWEYLKERDKQTRPGRHQAEPEELSVRSAFV